MKRVCSVCKTTSFKRSSDSGLVCKYGHKALGIQQEQTEEETFISGMRLRKRAKITAETNKLTPSQHKSYEIQIMQFGLQLMGRAMVQDLHFPSEFETALRELWLFFLSESKTELDEAYMFDVKEKHKKVQDPLETEDFEDLSLFQEDDDYIEDENAPKETEDSRPKKLAWPILSYPQTLSFIYLTCIYLRYPVLPADIITWCETDQLPYIIADRIPEDILGAMSLDRLLKMHRPPTVLVLRTDAFRMAQALQINSGLEFPNYNTPLLLDRFCSYFFLPVEGHFYASRLYNEAIRGGSAKDKTFTTKKLRNPSVSTWKESRFTPVSALLLACVVATAKIFYNIDGSKIDLQKVCRYNKSVSKESWLKKIHVNTKLWLSRLESTEKLDFVIGMLKRRTRADVITTSTKHRLDHLANCINADIPKNIKNQSYPLGLFMKPPEVLEMNVDHQTRQVLDEKSIYYFRQFGFRPDEYVSLLKLASLIEGNAKKTEDAMGIIDAVVLHIFPPQKSNEVFDQRYEL